MDFKFQSLAAALGLKTADAAITEANLQQANDKIEALERDKTGAEQRAQQAQEDLTKVKAELTTTKADLTKATDKVATLEQWKREQQATDGRTEDASNDLDGDDKPQLAAFEVAGQQAVNRVKGRQDKNKGK